MPELYFKTSLDRGKKTGVKSCEMLEKEKKSNTGSYRNWVWNAASLNGSVRASKGWARLTSKKKEKVKPFKMMQCMQCAKEGGKSSDGAISESHGRHIQWRLNVSLFFLFRLSGMSLCTSLRGSGASGDIGTVWGFLSHLHFTTLTTWLGSVNDGIKPRSRTQDWAWEHGCIEVIAWTWSFWWPHRPTNHHWHWSQRSGISSAWGEICVMFLMHVWTQTLFCKHTLTNTI